ncbi:type 1 glutamine amidotransferase [Streptomyces nigra]|uniref:type 1 glutamine amidotransferase n=1 Tax=Streptomyces nigra TaxID=1827580 RepID=UPI003456C1B5
MARLLVVQNAQNEGLGRFGEWLGRDGLSVEVVHAYAEAPLPGRLEHHGVIVLGGGLLPDDDGRAPWLAHTRFLIAEALAQSVPVLGICLGGQMLAHVAGGTVQGGYGEPEVGSTSLTVRAEAAEDPLFRNLPRQVTAVENHVDAVTALPSGAVWLVESEQCPYQAFRLGNRAWGLQFHPEAGADRVRSWCPQRLRARGLDPVALEHRAERDEAEAALVWREFARRFASVVEVRTRS